jgi:hypothetical protein
MSDLTRSVNQAAREINAGDTSDELRARALLVAGAR